MNIRRALHFCLIFAAGCLALGRTGHAYVLEGEKWPAGTQISLDLQLGAPSTPLLDGSATWNRVAVDAMNIWNPLLGSGVQFQANEQVLTPAQGDGRNSVFFNDTIYGESFGSDTLAVTVLQYTQSTTTEADVIVNQEVPFDSYRGALLQTTSGQTLCDLRRVLIHEFGHVLGLAHSDVGQAIMYPYISDLDTVQFDDINGITAIYGPPLRMPVVTSASTVGVQVNTSFSYEITATGGQIVYGASGLPPGLAIEAAYGYITGTPTQVGTFVIGLTATNAVGTAYATLTLTVSAAPTMTSPSFVTALVGLPFSYQFTATIDPTSFGQCYAPPGLTYVQSKGFFSGVPTTAGSFNEYNYLYNGAASAVAPLTIDIEYDLAATILSSGSPGSSIALNPIVLGADGNCYGTFNSSIFRLTSGGVVSLIASSQPAGSVFPGIFINPGLTPDLYGNLYGTASVGGEVEPITVFRLSPNGVMTTFGQLTDDSVGVPHAPMILGRDGNLYGTCHQGASGKPGAIFQVTPAGVFTILHRFDANTEGIGPMGLLQWVDGNLYGTTNVGGPGGGGTVFKVTPAGELTTLWSFSTSGPTYPNGQFVRGPDGNLYGTTGNATQDGPYIFTDTSSLFRVTPDGTVTIVRTTNKAGPDAFPEELVQGADGQLYGIAVVATGSSGDVEALKRYAVDGTNVELHRFNGPAPLQAPVAAADGSFYCITVLGAFERIVTDHAPGSITYVSVLATQPDAYAATGQQATLTVSRGGSTDNSAELSVYLTYDGVMGISPDQSPLPSVVIIPAGAASVDIPVAASNAAEGSLNVSVAAGSNYAVNPNAGVTVVRLYTTSPTAHPAFCAGEVSLSNGVYYLSPANGNPFGYYAYLTDPRYLYHFDMGYEYWFEANDGKSGVYLYDFKSGGFFYSSPTFPFPYLYDFSLNTVLYYYPDPANPGRYNTGGIRYFYRFDTGKIITR